MKKTILRVAVMALLFAGCSDDNNNLEQEQAKVDMSDFYLYTDATEDGTNTRAVNGKKCNSMTVLNRRLNENPGLYQKMYNIELHSRQFIANLRPPGGNGNGNGGGPGGDNGGGDPVDDGLGIVTIPVYVHVLYNTNTENISDSQIQSQIDVLNEDFRKTNNDASLVPSEFAPVATDTEIEFTLAGITRKQSSITDWGTSDNMKSSSSGGINPITPETHLNIWVVNKMSYRNYTVFGFAQFPGDDPSTDGVVVAHPYFGNTGTAGSVFPEINLGRTATHEVGHYLNLRHIWGDGRCNRDDFVYDTPKSDRSNQGCPSYPTEHCRSNDMTMNYMDYTNDSCMYMFSDGQKERMRAVFAPGGPRASIVGN
ncbi:MAG: zinc metalloprotease [Winogradskyella sp.]|uniref:zinc metalloprotease n=1 Tax=Winogradskyella sp. TaxID=1883156 RepID=UPI0017A14443|nr:zinc metalloprotease [Winogradskyella sp.]MBT8244335.1 zinc metalloprotease [Winogradskyella sp.]NNK22730.1 zinc metalloprotease [Winogradskyella sp.]